MQGIVKCKARQMYIIFSPYGTKNKGKNNRK